MFGLGSIYITRMLGLFMVLPVLTLYAQDLKGATPLLLGWAMGIYGLFQALFQIPFGIASDHFGRKKLLTFGLLLFVSGSICAALASDIYTVIFGRALQGAGAVAAVIMALAADLTREEKRVRIMAVLGASIGGAFILSLIIGPLVTKAVGLSGLFWLTAFLGVGALVVLHFVVPTPQSARRQRDASPVPEALKKVLMTPCLMRLNVGIFLLHLVITACFVVVPLHLNDLGVAADAHWQVYLGTLVVAVLGMLPLVGYAEAKQRLKPMFLISILGLALAFGGLWFGEQSYRITWWALVVFFTFFTVLEALLPSTLSKLAPAASKGSAMGVYASAQFFGSFLGGVMGGWLFGLGGAGWVFLCMGGVVLLWLPIALGMQNPKSVSNRFVRLMPLNTDEAEQLSQKLHAIEGVAEAVVIAEEQMAYLKVYRKRLDEQALQDLCDHYSNDPVVAAG